MSLFVLVLSQVLVEADRTPFFLQDSQIVSHQEPSEPAHLVALDWVEPEQFEQVYGMKETIRRSLMFFSVMLSTYAAFIFILVAGIKSLLRV